MNEKISDHIKDLLEKCGGTCLNPLCNNSDISLFLIKGTINMNEEKGYKVFCGICGVPLELTRRMTVKSFIESARLKFMREFSMKYGRCQTCGNDDPADFSTKIKFDSFGKNPKEYAKLVKENKSIFPIVHFFCNSCNSDITEESDLNYTIDAMEKSEIMTRPYENFSGMINYKKSKTTGNE